MGAIYEMNTIIKLNKDDVSCYTLGKDHSFVKDGMRIYPIDVPIDLINDNWEAVACCVIKTITISKDKTEGTYTVLEIYDAEKRQILTSQWRRVLQYAKGEETIVDYHNVHIT